ncbi:MAG TPA: hypothetical protein VHY36_01650 [Steroidobacteraceae bacterium]|nr:hypothetical protein [Steroidobacteraceae bacterium]
MAPVQSGAFHTVYVRLGSEADEGLLYEPTSPGPKAHVALLFSHPDGNSFAYPVGAQMAARGYRILMVNHHGADDGLWTYAPGISNGIRYLRTLPGAQRVIVIGHSGGAPLMAFYDNVAEHGPAACDGPEELYPCPPSVLNNLARPDGVILLDPPLGAFHAMSGVDPAVHARRRIPALDMFSQANGFDPATGQATYSRSFTTEFYAAQSARSDRIVDKALARLRAIEQDKGEFRDDEPFVVPGMGVNAAGARLYQTDPAAFLSHTKQPHILLEADGSTARAIIRSVRRPLGQFARDLGMLDPMTQNVTVRSFLAEDAIRTTSNFAITADDIVGVQWASSPTSTPANAVGITVPALVMVMSCHYFIVPGEIVYDHLASRDRTYAAVEGASHMFTPCRPQYGDTVKRTFDFVDAWLSKPSRF